MANESLARSRRSARSSSSASSTSARRREVRRPQLTVVSSQKKANESFGTRAQSWFLARRAPLIYVIAAVTVLFASLMGTLVLRTMMVENSFAISNTQSNITKLTQDVEAQKTKLEKLEASLPQKAEKLGMTASTDSLTVDMNGTGEEPNFSMSRLRRLRNYGSTFRRRSLVILLVVALLACVCIVRLAYVQMYKGEYYSSQATSARLYTRTTQAIRGEITDDSGEVLAQSVQRYTIYVDQNGARNFTPIKCTGTNSSTCHSINGKNVTGKGPAAVAKMLAPLLKMDVNELGAQSIWCSGIRTHD